MRKYLISMLLLGLIIPMSIRGANADDSKVSASSSKASAVPSQTDKTFDTMYQQLGKELRQASQKANHVAITLPSELAQTPDDLRVIVSGEDAAAAARRLKIEAALSSPTTLEFVDTPLKEVADYLKDLHHIEIQLDTTVMKDAGVEPDVAVTKNLKGISLRAALRLLLGDLNLKYAIRNEVLMITTRAMAESVDYTSTRMYPVKDLVLVKNGNGAYEVDDQHLMDLITETVATKTWTLSGGKGVILPFVDRNKGRCFLVVSQTDEVHEQVVAFLDALRGTSATSEKIKAAMSEIGNARKPLKATAKPAKRPNAQPAAAAADPFGK